MKPRLVQKLRPDDPNTPMMYQGQQITAREFQALEYRHALQAAGMSTDLVDREKTEIKLEVNAEEETAVLSVVGPFDDWWGVDVRNIASQIEEAKPKSLLILIESPGGYAFDGLFFYSALKRFCSEDDGTGRSWGMQLSIEAQGLVASAATLPWLAADTRKMSVASVLMVHAPWGWLWAVGTEWDMKQAYEESRNALRALRRRMEAVYVMRTKQDAKEVASMIRGGDKWMDPSDALELGYATEIEAEVEDDEDDSQAVIDTTDIPPASDRGKALGRLAGLSMGRKATQNATQTAPDGALTTEV